VNRKIVLLVVAAVLVTAAILFLVPGPGRPPLRKAVATRTPLAVMIKGRALFVQNCMICHGRNAKGTDKGPPLVHRIYAPNHHGDIAFYAAVERGVRQHHWRFGDMKRLPNIQREKVAQIIAYVRSLQKKEGIFN